MIGSWKRAVAAGALCLGLAAATAGVAQDRPQGPGAGQRGPGQHGGPDRQKMFEEMRARHEKVMHDLLQIKPEQEGAFKTFLAAVAPPHMPGPNGAKDGQRGPGHTPGAPRAPMTTPERLDRMTARLAHMQQTIAATRTFYGVLSPDQRKAFDAMPMMMGRHGHHGHMGHGGHRFEGGR